MKCLRLAAAAATLAAAATGKRTATDITDT